MQTAEVEHYTCAQCDKPFDRRANQRGRKPKYCGGRCRNLAYEERLAARLANG